MPTVKLKNSGGQTIAIENYPIDMVGVIERANCFSKRSIKKESKIFALNLAVSMTDLTTLEGADTVGKIQQLCGKAINPVPQCYLDQIKGAGHFSPIPHTAAICVYPELVKVAAPLLKGSGVELAAVSTAFPSGQLDSKLKLKDVSNCIKNGASEIDMVIDRGAFLKGNYQKVFDEIVAVKELCENKAHLKVILETGELETFDKVRLASMMAMEAGADFIKTSTGKVASAANMPVTLVMLQAIWDFYQVSGRKIGMKPAGGIRTAKQAIAYLVMVNEILGEDWLSPKMFRFGASSLLNDLLRQIFKQYTGEYYYQDIFSID